jgi:L-alanine-DL-glutamate epimerase-like enolase superfamily enzyme
MSSGIAVPTPNERVQQAVNTASGPSQLRITDMRMAVVRSNFDYPIIRLDTNQGICGIGEVRDAGHREDALRLKSILLGQNPLNVDFIFGQIKRFGGAAREGGGVSGLEIALWDLVGKVYGAPIYQFLGGKHRDKVRIYADTTQPHEITPEGYVERVMQRKALGFTFIKFDLGVQDLVDQPNAVGGTPAEGEYPLSLYHQRYKARGSHGKVQLTEEGIARYVEIVKTVRQAVGWDTFLAIDHLGEITVDDAIRLGRALEPYSLAWIEDVIRWWDIEGNRRVTEAIQTPTLNGEDIYLWDGWGPMIEARAIDIIQPDLLSSGGMLETKKIADHAERYDMPTALHFAGSPIAYMANLHCAAAIRSFVALENHAVDLPFWKHLVKGMDDPAIVGGYATVPDKPGLGVELDYEGIEANLRIPGDLFLPTEQWNTPKVGSWRPDPKENWD